MQPSSTLPHQDAAAALGTNEQLASVTRKGQITLPIEIRRSLGVGEGDKVAVSIVQIEKGGKPQAILKPVHSVAQMTYGAVSTPPSIKKPADIKALRRAFQEGVAAEVMAETPQGSRTTSTRGDKAK